MEKGTKITIFIIFVLLIMASFLFYILFVYHPPHSAEGIRSCYNKGGECKLECSLVKNETFDEVEIPSIDCEESTFKCCINIA